MATFETMTDSTVAVQAHSVLVSLQHPDAVFQQQVLVTAAHGPTIVWVGTLPPTPPTAACGRTFAEACARLAAALLDRYRELRDRGDDQLTAEDLRVWGQLRLLLVLRDEPPPAPADGWWHRREALGRGWWLDCWSTGHAVLTWHSPRWPEREGVVQAVLHLEPAEARHLAALLEGRVT